MTALTAAIFYVILSMVDVGSLISTFASISPVYLLAFLALSAMVIIVVAKRYQEVLRYMGSPVSFSRCFTVNMAIYPLVAVTPSVSGYFFKMLYLKDEAPPAEVAGSVVAERLFDLMALAGLVLLGLAFAFNPGLFIACAAVVICGGGLALVAGMMDGRLQSSMLKKLDEAISAFNRILRTPGAAIRLTAYTVVMWSLTLVQAYLFFMAVGATIPYPELLSGLPASIMVGQLPVTLGGMGTRDGAMLELFKGSAGFEQIVAVGLLFSLFRYWLPSLAGIPFLLYENARLRRDNVISVPGVT